MYAVAIVGPESTTLVERLADRLASAGRVATVSSVRSVDAEGRPDGASVAHRIGTDGWTASGEERSVRSVLDDCARDCDYLLADGVEARRLPTIAAGTDREDAVGTVETAARADLEALIETIEETEPHESLESLVAEVKRAPSADRSGAIATFTGRVRARDAEDDARTELLEFEKYEGVAEERMAAIGRDLEGRDGVFEVRMHHRSGVIRDGEDIVFVVVLAGHREKAFRTVEDGINRLKDEVPIFKKEVTVDEEFWVHDRA